MDLRPQISDFRKKLFKHKFSSGEAVVRWDNRLKQTYIALGLMPLIAMGISGARADDYTPVLGPSNLTTGIPNGDLGVRVVGMSNYGLAVYVPLNVTLPNKAERNMQPLSDNYLTSIPFPNQRSYVTMGDINHFEVEGGGTVQVGGYRQDFDARTLKELNIYNGTLSVIRDSSLTLSIANQVHIDPKFPGPYADRTVDLYLGGAGVLDLTQDTTTTDDTYKAVVSLNGSGKVLVGSGNNSNVFYVGRNDLGATKDSIFSGTIQGPSSRPTTGSPDDGPQAGFNAVYTNLKGATIRDLALLSFGSRQTNIGDAPSYDPSNKDFYLKTDINDQTHINVDELRIGTGIETGQGTGAFEDKYYNETVNISGVGTEIDTKRLNIGIQQAASGYSLEQEEVSQGIVTLQNGAALNVNGDVYLGNAKGYSGHLNVQDVSGVAYGFLSVQGDSGQPGGRMAVHDGGLWVGPVDGGSGRGMVSVANGGQVQLDNALVALGGQTANPASTDMSSFTGSTPVNTSLFSVGKGGTLNVTGMTPGAMTQADLTTFNNTQNNNAGSSSQGTLNVADGGTMNIGSASAAGLLRLYGDLNLQKGSTTTFYEGTTTAEGNKNDAYNSHADVHGNVTLGGNIQIAGITGQNKGSSGAVDAGMYHLIDYTGTLSGQDNAQLLKTAAGQTLSYVHDDATKSVDVLVSAVTDNNSGNIIVSDGATLDIVGVHPLSSVGKTGQKDMIISSGSKLNIGNATTAGLLQLYGDLNLQKGSTTTFYEGTTTAKGNKGDAYNSHIEVNGSVALGGNIQIAGITGQNKGSGGAVDAGMYHLIDYTGTLSGQDNAQLLKTAAGQTLSYVHDDATKSVDVMVGAATGGNAGGGNNANNGSGNADKGGNNTPTPTISSTQWSGGDAIWNGQSGLVGDKAPSTVPAQLVLNGDKGGAITVDNGKTPLAASSVDFQGSNYAIKGGDLTAGTGNNGQNTLSVNTADGKSATIASNIVDNGGAAAGLVKSGTGTLTLSGNNTYSGVTGVQQGTLDVASGAVLSDKSQVAVVKGATLNVAGQVGQIVNNGIANVTGKTGDISNSGGTATVSGTAASMTNTGTVNISGTVSGTLNQQSGTVNLTGNANVGILQSNGTQDLDHLAGLDRVDGKNSESRAAFVEKQLASTDNTQAKALLTAVQNVFSKNYSTVKTVLQNVGNLFSVADNATVNVGTLTGYATGYLGNNAVLKLGSNSNYGDAIFDNGNGTLEVTGTNNTLVGTNYITNTKIDSAAELTAQSQALGTGTITIEGADQQANKAAGVLTVVENASSTLDSTLAGSGTFNKAGTGSLTLTADNSAFGGTTNVQKGELAVEKTLNGSTNVAAGAMISGSGTVNNLTLDKNAYLGVSIEGKSGVAGPLTLTGTENKLGGASVAMRVSRLSDMTIKKRYQTTVLKLGENAKADGTLNTDTVHAINTAFVSGTVSRNGNDWVLDYVRTAGYSSYASSHNEHQIAQVLTRADAAGEKTSFLTAIPNIQEGAAGAVRGAYNALSGEINASAKTAMVNDSFNIQEAVIDRLDCAGDALRARAHDGKQQTSGYCDIDPRSHVTVWGTVYGQQGNQSGGGGTAGMNQSSVGWIMGADTQLKGGWRVGGMLAYGRDWFGVQSGRSSSAHSNSATIGAYVGNAWRVGGLTDDAAITFKGGVSYSWNMLHTNRRIMYPGYNTRLSSNNRTGTGQVFAETGYRMGFKLTKDIPLEVEPFVRMTYLNYGNDSFREHGANAALNVKGQNSSIGFSTFGVKLASSVNIGKMVFSPHVGVGYRRAFGRTNATAREGFAALGGGYDMNVQGTGLSVSTAQINTGFAARLTDRLDVNIDYIGQYGSRQTSTGGSGSFHYRF